MPNFNQSLGDAFTYLAPFTFEVNGSSLGSLTGIDVNSSVVYANPTVTIEVNGFGIAGDVGPQDFENNSTLLVFADVISLSENIVKADSHIVYDTDNLTDTLAKSFSHAYSDVFTVTDALSKNDGRRLADTTVLSDSITKADSQVLTDAAPIMDFFSDYVSSLFTLTDTISLNDVEHNSVSTSFFTYLGLAETFSKATNRPLSDPFALVETYNSGKSTSLQDTVGLVEFYTNAFSTSRLDFVIPVDLINRATTTNIADILTILDFFSAGWGKSLANTFTVIDSYNAATSFHLFDVNGTMEVINFATDSNQTDALTLLDFESAAWARTLADNFVPSESILLVYGINLHLSDSVTLTDATTLTQTLSRYYSDAVALTDSINFDTVTNLSDLFMISDSIFAESFRGVDFSDTLSLSDASNLNTNSNQHDSLTVNEFFALAVFSNQTDLITIFDYLSDYVSQVVYLDEDPIILVETASIATAHNLADTAAVGDAVNFATVTGLADVLTILESATALNSRNFTYADSLTFSDSYNADTVSNQKDFTGLTDAWSYNGVFNDTYSDSIDLTDSSNLDTTTNLLDALGMDDSFSYLKGLSFVYADSLPLLESVNFDVASNQSDTTPILESINLSAVTNLFDALTLADSFTIQNTLNAVETDTIDLTDAAATMATLFRSLSDVIALADVEASNSARFVSFADALTLTDTVTAGTSYRTSLTDTLTLADSNANTPGKSLVDAVTLADSYNAATGTNLNDLVSIFDTLFNNNRYNHAVSDSLNLTDAPVFFSVGKLGLDLVSILESIKKATASLGHLDTLTLSDTFAHSQQEKHTVTDGVSLLEFTNKNIAHTITDTFTFSDMVSLHASNTYLNFLEAFTLAEDFSPAYQSVDNFKHTFKVFLEAAHPNGLVIADWVPALGHNYTLVLNDLETGTSYSIYVNSTPLGTLTQLDVNGNPTGYAPGGILEVNSVIIGAGGFPLEEFISKTPKIPVVELPLPFVEVIATKIAHGPLQLLDQFGLVDSLYTSPLSDGFALSEQFFAVKATMLKFIATPRLDLKYPALISWMRGTKGILPAGMPWGFLAQSTGIGSLPVPTSYFDAEETPAGTLGTTGPFTLSSIPTPSTSLQLYKNGALLALNLDYTLNNNVITFEIPTVPTDVILAVYQGVLS